MRFYLKFCRRCRGDLILDNSRQLYCLQCGWYAVITHKEIHPVFFDLDILQQLGICYPELAGVGGKDLYFIEPPRGARTPAAKESALLVLR